MKRSKKITVLILMSTSILLLVVLQVLWLQKVYDDEISGLRKESNFIFRNTIRSMMDSIIQKNMIPLGDDTANVILKDMNPTFAYNTRELRHGDKDSGRIEISGTRVQVFVGDSVNNDSIVKMIKPFASSFRNREGRTFVLRMEGDSLTLGDLHVKYGVALAKAGIELPFTIHRVERKEHAGWRDTPFLEMTKPEGINTELTPASPFIAYTADFKNYQGIILKSILPQILFSLFLTLLTVGSFVVMYRSLRSQQRLMELKNEFISNISHELKTPVATVSVAIEALRNFDAIKNPETTREYLDIAQNELSRLTIMTDKILKTSVFERNGVTFIPEPVDLAQVVDQVVASLKLLLEQRNGKVEISRNGGSYIVHGSPTHLTNVVYNLVDNAIKYCAENPSIKITLDHNTQGTLLAVADNGIGIPYEYKDKVFDKFFRVPTGDVHNAKGYGLGLSYVASVIKSHGGKISLKSSSSGSTFNVLLPQ